MFLAKSMVGYKLCRPGDLVINTMWAWMGALGVSRHSGIVSPSYGVYRPLAGCQMDHHYSDLLLRTPLYAREYERRSTGVNSSRLRLYPEHFLRMPIVVPPPDEQAAIVKFLSWANGRLDRAIRAKRKIIALLNEQKQAVIHRAVTRGLDPSVPLKPSGSPWLGDVPRHWETRRLKFTTSRIVDCVHATPQYSQSGTHPAIRTADIQPGLIQVQKARRVSHSEYERWTQRMQPVEGDILYSREGERFGIAACVPAGVELCISQRMMAFRVAVDHCSSFVMWSLNCRSTYVQALQDVTGATSPHVNISTIRNFLLALPPAEEQAQIIRYIDATIGPIGETILRLRREIDLLREYQSRLVADVVTGKLDVRCAADRIQAESMPDPDARAVELDDESEPADEEAAG